MGRQPTSYGVVTYSDSEETRDAVFKKVLDWFLEQEVFCGESIMQSDAPQLESPILLSDLADDIFKFSVTEHWEND